MLKKSTGMQKIYIGVAKISDYLDTFGPQLSIMIPIIVSKRQQNFNMIHIDLSQAEKKINVVTIWANAQNDNNFTQNYRSFDFEWLSL